MRQGNKLPLNLQFFAEEGQVAQEQQVAEKAAVPQQQTVQQPTFDYEKLASIIQGKQTTAEEVVLKGYFKQQGLSEEEMDAAIAAFKQQQEANKPNVNEIQLANEKFQTELRESRVINKAMLLSNELGIDIKSVPYITKLADLSSVFAEDGTLNEDKLKESFNKVLEDVPGFKVAAGDNSQSNTGFRQIGGNGQQQNDNQEDILKGIFGIRK